MSDLSDREYRIAPTALAVVRGSQSRAVARQQARAVIQREAHNLVLHATSEGIPSDRFDWWADLRRQRRRVWGGLLRFVDALIEKGHPEHLVQIIPRLLSEYIADQYRGGNPPPSNERAA